ncbi:Arm DNA-binding domain-containing protein [Leisingera caerulea]|uniref:Arm DNA-binding domain-containing protein n=1 Tax=Leisingera caerulea TaxID=506591 RepID=UPI0021A83F0F|nr:Arm DNA-binding domain-containing protein [Leisingera caerulea]UWQ82937.1 Arm DNA-binding domain-containing protein [Leisingera caerulea]
MPTEACEIDRRIVAKAEKLAEQGTTQLHVFRDYGGRGLHLRVRGKRAVWLVKFQQKTKTIGQLYPDPSDMSLRSTRDARQLAADVRSVMKAQPEHVDKYLKLRHQNFDHLEALERLVEPNKSWTLAECFEVAIAEKSSSHAKRPIAAKTKKDMEYVFSLDAWGELIKRPVTELVQGDIEAVRDSVRKENGLSTSTKVIAYTRSVLNWCAKHHSGASGLSGQTPWWRMLSTPAIVKPKVRRPHVRDIVKSLLIAEKYLGKPLPGRSIRAKGVHALTLGGLWWVVLTCQRSGAALSLAKDDLLKEPEPDECGHDWLLASWDDNEVKGKKRFVLPVPSRAWTHVHKFLSLSTGYEHSDLLLPSAHDIEKSVTGSGVYRVLYRLSGRDAKNVRKLRMSSRKSTKNDHCEKKPDLLAEAGISWWSLHDVRRTLSEFLSCAGCPGGSSAVLSHVINDRIIAGFNLQDQDLYDRLKQSPAKITSNSYHAHSPYMKLKREAMQLWVDEVLDEYERQKGGS